ncbi:hypothetical protein [Lacibacter sediminis]|uniref:Uncharacterized protein n=1 Tax=Lacibacter sediminis TaxID=2760713 RepID=A0A7G5XGT2_9BACT|nr:hypothetical protein [Lacibacter sediminis]QNA44685.1 hypothetical protein H4075_00365 [Lacibacter sediminis]
MEHQQDVLTEIVTASQIKRSKLLPWWIKIFMWIFLIIGFLIPILLIAAVAGFDTQLAIYGLETNNAFTLTGILLILVFALKGFVSFGMVKEKDWAIKLGAIDAILGIVICVFTSYIYPFISEESASFSLLKFELIFLIPYLIKLLRIKNDWESARAY